MTSTQLSEILSGFHAVAGAKHQFSPSDVYFAASLAQKEIANRLRLFENIASLVSVANQERYQYSPATITDAQGSNPVTITAAGHGLQTGDTCEIGGALGKTGINGEHVVTRVDADHITIPVTDANAWTSGGILYHALWAMIESRDARMTSPYEQILEKITKGKAELDRAEFGVKSSTNPTPSVTADAVTQYYEIHKEPIIIGLRGTPNEVCTFEFQFFRTLFPHEDISSTVNPLVPARYDSLLVLGAKYYLYMLSNDDVFRQRANDLNQQWENEIAKTAESNAMDSVVLGQGFYGLRW